MYSLLYFISHPTDVSNATISGLIDWINTELTNTYEICINIMPLDATSYITISYNQ
jgi:hypothetical protein